MIRTYSHDTIDLVINTVFNMKTGEVENKIPDVSMLVTNTALNKTIEEVKNKVPDHSIYFITSNFNKCTTSIFDAKSKETKLARKRDLATVEQLTIETIE